MENKKICKRLVKLERSKIGSFVNVALYITAAIKVDDMTCGLKESSRHINRSIMNQASDHQTIQVRGSNIRSPPGGGSSFVVLGTEVFAGVTVVATAADVGASVTTADDAPNEHPRRENHAQQTMN